MFEVENHSNMKFGKRLLHDANPEWVQQFIAYKDLKHLLKQIFKQKDFDESKLVPIFADAEKLQGTFLNVINENKNIKERAAFRNFFERLQQEVEKVSKFYTEQEKKIGKRHKMLFEQLKTMVCDNNRH